MIMSRTRMTSTVNSNNLTKAESYSSLEVGYTIKFIKAVLHYTEFCAERNFYLSCLAENEKFRPRAKVHLVAGLALERVMGRYIISCSLASRVKTFSKCKRISLSGRTSP